MKSHSAICGLFLYFLQLLPKLTFFISKVGYGFNIPAARHDLLSSPAFAGGGQQVPSGHCRFPELPQGGNICAMFGLVVTLDEQLGETEHKMKFDS